MTPVIGAVVAVLGVLTAAMSLPRYRRVRRPVVHGTVIAASGDNLTVSLPTGEEALAVPPTIADVWRTRLTYEDDTHTISVAEGPSGLMLAEDLDRQLRWPRMGLAGGCCFAVIGLLALDQRLLLTAVGLVSAALAVLLLRPPRTVAKTATSVFLGVGAVLALVGAWVTG